MVLQSYIFHLRARNLSPRTIKVTEEYLRLFIAQHDPFSATRRDIEAYLGSMSQRCKPSTVWTAWRHLKSFFTWLHSEGDIEINPIEGVTKPIVPPSEIQVLNQKEIQALLSSCRGKDSQSRRDLALIAIMLDTGLRLSEVTALTVNDISECRTIRVFGKGRKWRTVALGSTSSLALSRWLRVRPTSSESVWTGPNGPLSTTGIRKVIIRRGLQSGIQIHPHQLRHTFVDNWLRNGGAEVDLARLCGWSSTRMAERYAQHRADERALSAHAKISPLDGSF